MDPTAPSPTDGTAGTTIPGQIPSVPMIAGIPGLGGPVGSGTGFPDYSTAPSIPIRFPAGNDEAAAAAYYEQQPYDANAAYAAQTAAQLFEQIAEQTVAVEPRGGPGPSAAQQPQQQTAGDFYRPGRNRSRSPPFSRRRSRSPPRRGRDWDRNSRSRSRSRSPSTRRRSRDRDRDRSRDRSRDRRGGGGGGGDRWQHDMADEDDDRGDDRGGHHREGRDGFDRGPRERRPVQKVLEEYGGDLEGVQVQMDRNSGESRGFAFAKFTSTEAAQSFIEANYPHIWVGGLRLRVDYSNRPSHSAAAVAAAAAMGTFQGVVTISSVREPARPEPVGSGTGMYNDGLKDVGAVPNKILIVRGLDTLTTEELLHRKLKELAPALKEIRLVRDRQSKMSSGFAFAELPDDDAARALLNLISTPEGLEIDGRKVTAAYAHHGSFMPTYTYTPWVASSVVDALGKTLYQQYWDENAYCSTFPSPPLPPPEPVKQAKKKAKKEKKDGLEDELSAFYSDVAKVTPPEPSPVVSLNSRPELANMGGSATDIAPTDWTEESGTKKTVMSLGTIASKKASVNIKKWAAVVDQEDPEQDEGQEEERPEPVVVPTVDEVNATQVDLAINACLLCQRQFPSVDKLRKHQSASDLHKTNMEQFLATKREEAAKADAARTQWKDRAAERRKAFGQPNKPPRPQRHFAGGPGIQGAKTNVVEEPTKHGIGGDNIGNQLLKKLGWKEGEGLGRDGGGIVDPVKAEGYSRGAGLGSGAKTSGGGGGHTGFEDYAKVTREAWRKRAEEME